MLVEVQNFAYGSGNYVRRHIHEGADLMVEIKRRVRLMTACHEYKRFGPELYDVTTARLSLKVRLQKAEVIETCCTGV